jgi:zinc transporter 7
LQFTDGIAIGASYSHYTGTPTDTALQMMKSHGGVATLSILFHEIPHELGDFAILVKQGFSKRQAIMAQFGTAIAAMLGTWVGLMMAHIAGEELILVTAGGFVYLAAVNILPEILDEERSARFRMMQILFFAIGIGFLYAVSLLEEMDEHGGHSHGHHHHESHAHVHTESTHHHSHHDHDHHMHGDMHLTKGHDHSHGHHHNEL